MTIAQAIQSTLAKYPEGHRNHLRSLSTLLDSLRYGSGLPYAVIQRTFEKVVGWGLVEFDQKMQDVEAWEAYS